MNRYNDLVGVYSECIALENFEYKYNDLISSIYSVYMTITHIYVNSEVLISLRVLLTIFSSG